MKNCVNKQLKIHWLHSKGPKVIFSLLMSHDREPVCIDKDPIAEAALRVTLAQKGITPTEDLKIHLWKLPTINHLHYFFIDDEQNNLIQEGFNSVC